MSHPVVDVPFLVLGVGLAIYLSWKVKRKTGRWPWQ